MSSPSPGPLTSTQSLLAGSIGTRRVSNSFGGLSGLGQSGGQPSGPLTPPLSQQHSPNSFLANFSSRLISNKTRLPELLDITSGGSLSNNSNLLGFRNSMHTFGVVGGSVGGPPAPTLDMTEFPTLGGSNSNNVCLILFCRSVVSKMFSFIVIIAKFGVGSTGICRYG